MEYHGEHHIISAFDSGNETKMVEAWMYQLDPVTIRENFEDELLSLTEEVVALNERNAFLEGVASYLGAYEASDTEAMLKEVKRRFAEKGVKFTNTIRDWFQQSKKPSITQKYRRNLYDFCFALGMDYEETASFFLKSFLTIPYNYKDRVDAVYFYCLKMGRSYDTITRMLEEADVFDTTNPKVDFTEQIGADILSITDDEEFLRYLREHCFDKAHQFQSARAKLEHYINANKALVLNIKASNPLVRNLPEEDHFEFSDDDKDFGIKSTRKLLYKILGFDYMSFSPEEREKFNSHGMPEFPRETELHKIVTEKEIAKIEVSFDVLRKSLILMMFYNYYRSWQKKKKRFYMEGDEINENLYEFSDEVDRELVECGFIQLYPRNPFDGIILFCANSPNPLECLKQFLKKWYLQDVNDEDFEE